MNVAEALSIAERWLAEEIARTANEVVCAQLDGGGGRYARAALAWEAASEGTGSVAALMKA